MSRGLSPASCIISVLRVSRRGGWPFRLALHPLGGSPLCLQRGRFSGAGQSGCPWAFSARPWDPPAQGCLDSKCGSFGFLITLQRVDENDENVFVPLK